MADLEFTPLSGPFRKKVKAIRSGVQFFENVHRDAAAYLQQRMVDDVLAGQYVGVISGNLRRSQEVAPTSRFSTILFTDIVIAPYALFVLGWSRETYGQDYLRITLQLFEGNTRAIMQREFLRMMESIRKRDVYKYQNQFT